MKFLTMIIILIISTFSSASDWSLGPISVGDKLFQVEKILGKTAEYAGGCGVISLRKTDDRFPFFAQPYNDVELWFPSTDKNSLLGVIVLEFAPKDFQEFKATIENALNQDSKSENFSYFYLDGSLTWMLNQPKNLFSVRRNGFTCMDG